MKYDTHRLIKQRKTIKKICWLKPRLLVEVSSLIFTSLCSRRPVRVNLDHSQPKTENLSTLSLAIYKPFRTATILNRVILSAIIIFRMHNFDPESRKETLRIAVICSSNMNRSMEGHRLLQKKGFNISSYGTGTQVRIKSRNCWKYILSIWYWFR